MKFNGGNEIMTLGTDEKNISFQLHFHIDLKSLDEDSYRPTVNEFSSTLQFINQVIEDAFKDIDQNIIYENIYKDEYHNQSELIWEISERIKTALEDISNKTRIQHIESLSSFVIGIEIVNLVIGSAQLVIELFKLARFFKKRVRNKLDRLSPAQITQDYRLDTTLARRLNINLFMAPEAEIEIDVGWSWTHHNFFNIRRSDYQFFPAPNSIAYFLIDNSGSIKVINSKIRAYEQRNIIFQVQEAKKIKRVLPKLKKGDKVIIQKLSSNVFRFKQ